MQRDLQAQRRQVFLNNTSCLKARSAAPRVWQASSVGDLVPQVTGGRPLTHPIPEQVNMAEMTNSPVETGRALLAKANEGGEERWELSLL